MNVFYRMTYADKKNSKFPFSLMEVIMGSVQKNECLSQNAFKTVLENFRKSVSPFASLCLVRTNAIFPFATQRVILDYDFWFAVFPVTFYEFNHYCAEKGKDKPNTSVLLPLSSVRNVNWMEATAYCNWLSWKTGLMRAYDEKGFLLSAGGERTTDIKEVEGYRLPTAAEWQFVKRKCDFEERDLVFYKGNKYNYRNNQKNDLDQVLKEAFESSADIYRDPRDHEYCHDRYKLDVREEEKTPDVYIFDPTTTQRTNFFNPVGNESGSFHVLMDFEDRHRDGFDETSRNGFKFLEQIHETHPNRELISKTTFRIVRTCLSDEADDIRKGSVFIR